MRPDGAGARILAHAGRVHELGQILLGEHRLGLRPADRTLEILVDARPRRPQGLRRHSARRERGLDLEHRVAQRPVRGRRRVAQLGEVGAHGVLGPAVGRRLDQGRAIAVPGVADRGLRHAAHVHDVVAVGGRSRHPVRRGARGDALHRPRLAPLGGQRHLVVLAHEDDRQAPDRREVQGLVDEALIDGAVAEEGDRDLPAAPDLRTERRAACDRQAGPDDAVAAEDSELDVGDVHRAAEPAAVAARPAHELGHHAAHVAALRDHVPVTAVVADDVVPGRECRGGADGDRLLPDAAVRGARDDAGGEELRRPLLEPPDEVERAERLAEVELLARRRAGS